MLRLVLVKHEDEVMFVDLLELGCQISGDWAMNAIVVRSLSQSVRILQVCRGRCGARMVA